MKKKKKRVHCNFVVIVFGLTMAAEWQDWVFPEHWET